MSQRILLAGATGALGREVLARLKAEGHWVRILARSQQRAEQLLTHADELWIGDALDPTVLQGLCENIDIVVSCLGASVGMKAQEKRSYLEVDTPANLNLINAAKQESVRRFLYISLWIEPGYENNGYVQAHRQVETALASSGLSYTVLRPTGLFSAMNEFMTMAQGGMGMLPGGGHCKTNPVHDDDVAAALMQYLEVGPVDVGLGGPDVLTRRQILEMAFTALDKRPRSFSMPVGVMGLMARLTRPFDARVSDLMNFFAQVATTDCVAPKAGERQLKEYYRQLVIHQK